MPAFSVVVPTYNRPAQLTACVQALASMAHPREDFEVIVVDDGSPTAVAPLLTAFDRQLDLTVLRQSNKGPATARNAGATHARGRFLAFTDDDCLPSTDWLSKLAAGLCATANCAAGGRTLNALPHNLYSCASQLITDYAYSRHSLGSNGARFFATNNLSVPADPFREIGGFDEAFSRSAYEDREFCYRWLRHGYRLSYAPDAIVYHRRSMTLPAFCRQHFTYGRGAFHFYQAPRVRASDRMDTELMSFYTGLLRRSLVQWRSLRSWALVALLVISQAAGAGGFLWEKSHSYNLLSGRSG